MTLDKLTDEVMSYRQWMLEQHVDGCTIEESEGNSLRIASDVAVGEVNFYVIDGETVVEMRLEDTADGSPLFFLHLGYESEERAKNMYMEMLDVLDKRLNAEMNHVLLCCSCGMTTTFFAHKLNEVAKEQNLDYDFCATSVERAKESGQTYSAVLLAPQVGYELKRVREALPDVMVLELPAAVFGSYDANAAIRMLLEAQRSARINALNDLRLARDFDHSKSVLAISLVLRADEPTISYLVIDKGEERLNGMTIVPKLDVETAVDDLLSTLLLNGYTPESFDAIGVAVPGVVDDSSFGASNEMRDESLRIIEHMGKEWNVPIYVDNNATAAAAGCYVSQVEWNDVVFHAQPIGMVECDEGYVIDGLTRTGNRGYAGNMRCLANRFALSMDLDEAVWRYDGTRELVANYLCASICTVAPEAVYVWCDLLPDMEELRAELETMLPAEAIPELIPVSDYDRLTLIGEAALCLQRLVDQPENADSLGGMTAKHEVAQFVSSRPDDRATLRAS